MAYIAKTMFEDRIGNHRYDSVSNITGTFYNGSAFEVIFPGFLAVRGTKLTNEGYTGVNNENAFAMTKALNTTNVMTPIFACNPYDVQHVGHGRNNWAVGANTLDVEVPAEPVTWTRIHFDGTRLYRIGEGNLSTAIGTNTFFTIADGLFVPAASAPATNGAVYFTLEGTGIQSKGTRPAFTYYDVRAYAVAAAG